MPVTPAVAATSLVPVKSGFDQPLQVTNAGDGSNRLFVVERLGKIRIIKKGSLLSKPFLDISSQVANGDEQGLLGLAFDPKYESNRKFYVYFTRIGGDIAVNEYRASSSNPDVAVKSTGRRIITIAHPPATNHNGGALAFGKDGFLYIGTGDGGGAGNPGNYAQSKDSLLGKILRIDVTRTSGSRNYRIPPANPFVGKAGRDEIWSFGLRNPWRISFDRSRGDLWVADVGEGGYEEINRRTSSSSSTRNGRGQNYGWRVMEGAHCFMPSSGCNRTAKVLPVTEYTHVSGRCSVTGGFVYRGTKSPKLAGRYIFGDFCSGTIWSISRSASTGSKPTLLLETSLLISSFGEDEKGEVYVVDFGGGRIYRLART